MACPTFHMPLSKNRVPLKIPAVYHVLPSCSPLRYTCWLILIYHIRRYIPIMPLYMALKLGGHPSGWLHSRESESLICSFHRRRIMYRWTVGWFSAMPKIVISQFIAFYHAPKWLLFFLAHVWTDGDRPTWVPPAVPSAWTFAMSWRENALRSGWKCPWAPRPDRKLFQEPWGTFYLILWGLFFGDILWALMPIMGNNFVNIHGYDLY